MLENIDLTQKLNRNDYDKLLTKYQIKFRKQQDKLFKKKIPLIILYEGWDAAGKGGNIKRLSAKLDPRGYRAIPIAAPSSEELAHHYLWRFWKHIPMSGNISIFDRSWYGRVLVERVEGFANDEEWKRSYLEINEFEESLSKFGTIIIKFWIHIDKKEQYRRFKDRESNMFKSWKLTEDDWRNREKWDVYLGAVEDMFQNTSTSISPWHIIAGNDKAFARISTLKIVTDTIKKVL